MTRLPAEAVAALRYQAFGGLMPASAISEQILGASLMRPETGGKGE